MTHEQEFELWLARLTNVRQVGDHWEASCPCDGHEHEDRKRSLTIARGVRVAAVVTCHKGHRYEQIRDALRIDTRTNGRESVEQFDGTYSYVGEDGEVLFQVDRKPGKQFLQRRPDGKGGWLWNLQGVRRVLYRLPQVIEAVDAGQTIYVVEGERDVEALEAVGVVATCNPGGAGKWRAEYAQTLAGADVIVIQDKDRDDTGQRHAREVVGSLAKVQATTRLVEAKVGKDAADHIEAGLGVAEFVHVDAPASRASTLVAGDVSLPVIEAINAYQAMPDTDPIRVTLAVAATSELDGEPLWLQLVGAPSSGKSEAISMLRDVVDGRIGEITVAGMLGWSGTAAKGKPSGLLARIGDGHRLVTITDFSTVLSDPNRRGRAELFAFLRTVYDGYAPRENNSAPVPLEWEGRLTVVSAVTPQIDAFSAHADALGPRWLYLRMAEPSRDDRRRATTLARQHAARKEQVRQRARDAAVEAVTAARARIAGVEINEVDGGWIDTAAIVGTLIRSDVPREPYSAREISGVVTREEPFRMAIMLTILLRGLLALGLPGHTARRIMLRCALDSTPLVRRHVLTALSSGDTLNTSQIARALDMDPKVARFALEELELLGLVRGVRKASQYDDEHDDEDPRARRRRRDWTLHGDEGNLAAQLIDEVGRDVGTTPPVPPVLDPKSHTSSDPESSPRPAPPWGPGTLADAAGSVGGEA